MPSPARPLLLERIKRGSRIEAGAVRGCSAADAPPQLAAVTRAARLRNGISLCRRASGRRSSATEARRGEIELTRVAPVRLEPDDVPRNRRECERPLG